MRTEQAHFDTHRFVKRLTSAGMPEEVAEILAEEHSNPALPVDASTRSDIAAAEERIRAATREDIAVAEERIRAATREDIAAAEERIRAATREDIAAAEERIRAATREDIAAAELRLRAELVATVAEFKGCLADYKTSTLRWMLGTMVAFSGIVIAAMAGLR